MDNKFIENMKQKGAKVFSPSSKGGIKERLDVRLSTSKSKGRYKYLIITFYDCAYKVSPIRHITPMVYNNIMYFISGDGYFLSGGSSKDFDTWKKRAVLRVPYSKEFERFVKEENFLLIYDESAECYCISTED